MGPAPAPGCDEPTSRCQTLPSMWTLGQRSACYPRSTFLISVERLWPTHRGAAGSLEPAFAPVGSACRPHQSARLCSCTQRGRLPTVERTPSRASVTRFRRRPPQSNCPPGTVPEPVDGLGLGRRSREGSIPRAAPRGWRLRIDASCLSSTRGTSGQCQAAVKVHGVFPSFRG